jgi:hypothetical protein
MSISKQESCLHNVTCVCFTAVSCRYQLEKDPVAVLENDPDIVRRAQVSSRPFHWVHSSGAIFRLAFAVFPCDKGTLACYHYMQVKERERNEWGQLTGETKVSVFCLKCCETNVRVMAGSSRAHKCGQPLRLLVWSMISFGYIVGYSDYLIDRQLRGRWLGLPGTFSCTCLYEGSSSRCDSVARDSSKSWSTLSFVIYSSGEVRLRCMCILMSGLGHPVVIVFTRLVCVIFSLSSFHSTWAL